MPRLPPKKQHKALWSGTINHHHLHFKGLSNHHEKPIFFEGLLQGLHHWVFLGVFPSPPWKNSEAQLKQHQQQQQLQAQARAQVMSSLGPLRWDWSDDLGPWRMDPWDWEENLPTKFFHRNQVHVGKDTIFHGFDVFFDYTPEEKTAGTHRKKKSPLPNCFIRKKSPSETIQHHGWWNIFQGEASGQLT